MNKRIVVNNKGVLSNKGYKIITNVLWVLAIVSMVGLLIGIKELSKDVKELKSITITK